LLGIKAEMLRCLCLAQRQLEGRQAVQVLSRGYAGLKLGTRTTFSCSSSSSLHTLTRSSRSNSVGSGNMPAGMRSAGDQGRAFVEGGGQ